MVAHGMGADAGARDGGESRQARHPDQIVPFAEPMPERTICTGMAAQPACARRNASSSPTIIRAVERAIAALISATSAALGGGRAFARAHEAGLRRAG